MARRGLLTALGLMVAFVGLVPPTGANAAAPGKSTTTYRWTDDQGIVHYGDSIPPQYAEKEHAVINKQGVEVAHTAAQMTPEQLAAEAKTHDAVLKQQQHDSFLVATYTSVKDIESLRDVRLDQLRGQLYAAQQYVENLRSRLVALQTRVKRFRPYNSGAGARRMPDDLAEDLVHTLGEMTTQSNALQAKNDEVSSMKAQFDTDIVRWRELRESQAKR